MNCEIVQVKLNKASIFYRSPLMSSLRSGYRERERERDRDARDRDRSGSRDQDERYGRPGYERPPYERAVLDRSGPERYSHSPSPYSKLSIQKCILDYQSKYIFKKM